MSKIIWINPHGPQYVNGAIEVNYDSKDDETSILGHELGSLKVIATKHGCLDVDEAEEWLQYIGWQKIDKGKEYFLPEILKAAKLQNRDDLICGDTWLHVPIINGFPYGADIQFEVNEEDSDKFNLFLYPYFPRKDDSFEVNHCTGCSFSVSKEEIDKETI
ncbi:hypothetical protein [Aquamicrobium sp.]|uniref:hypothetical protein n=1 Tax=Aquamicrobium sp. TaxID=1872579 RepID=UPI00258E19AB|nr:hypothetical protein [Aquamicrobium sp.]MCK9553196.1 hypothetical protein [Aquamicrobium sp.]